VEENTTQLANINLNQLCNQVKKSNTDQLTLNRVQKKVKLLGNR